MKFTKTFVEVYTATDCEARRHEWRKSNKTFEEEKARLGRIFNPAVREIEETFDTEKWKMAKKVVRKYDLWEEERKAV